MLISVKKNVHHLFSLQFAKTRKHSQDSVISFSFCMFLHIDIDCFISKIMQLLSDVYENCFCLLRSFCL